LNGIKIFSEELLSEEQKKKITQQLYDLELRKTEVAYNLKNMVGLMDKQGIEKTEFGKVLIVATGSILSENIDTKAVVGIFQAAMNDALAWWKDNFPLILFRIISFILILLAFKILASIVGRFVNKLTKISDNQSSQLLNNFFRSMTSKTIMLIGFAVALSQLGIEIGPLLAGMGVMGFVVGFALQDTLSNFASGMMILVYGPYDVGDFVNVSGISGQVKEMNLVSTTVLTIDHQRMVIPNSKIWGDIITNVTAERLRRIDMVFGISYSDSIEKTEASILLSVPGLIQKITGTYIGILPGRSKKNLIWQESQFHSHNRMYIYIQHQKTAEKEKRFSKISPPSPPSQQGRV
jgi:small conductance mechanosensitive channel